MGALSPTHWLIIIGIAVVVFGAKRLLSAARSLGQSMRILRSEVRELEKLSETAASQQLDGPVV